MNHSYGYRHIKPTFYSAILVDPDGGARWDFVQAYNSREAFARLARSGQGAKVTAFKSFDQFTEQEIAEVTGHNPPQPNRSMDWSKLDLY